MNQHWRMRVRGKQRTEVNKGLLVQALIMLARQLEEENAQADKPARTDTYEPSSLKGKTGRNYAKEEP
jgi:hypothetical protein